MRTGRAGPRWWPSSSCTPGSPCCRPAHADHTCHVRECGGAGEATFDRQAQQASCCQEEQPAAPICHCQHSPQRCPSTLTWAAGTSLQAPGQSTQQGHRPLRQAAPPRRTRQADLPLTMQRQRTTYSPEPATPSYRNLACCADATAEADRQGAQGGAAVLRQGAAHLVALPGQPPLEQEEQRVRQRLQVVAPAGRAAQVRVHARVAHRAPAWTAAGHARVSRCLLHSCGGEQALPLAQGAAACALTHTRCRHRCLQRQPPKPPQPRVSGLR